MRVIVDDGVDLEVQVCAADRASAAPVVLSTASAARRRTSPTTSTRSRAHGHVVTLDLRGHGDSDRPGRSRRVLARPPRRRRRRRGRRVGLDTFRVLGHSMGGMVARRVVLRQPDRVEALVLMSTAAGPPPGLDPDLVDLGAQLAIEQGIAALKRDHRRLRPPGHAGVRADCSPSGRASASSREWKWSRLSAVMWARSRARSSASPTTRAPCATSVCPTLVMVGEHDGAFFGVSHAVAATIAGAGWRSSPTRATTRSSRTPTPGATRSSSFLRRPRARRPEHREPRRDGRGHRRDHAGSRRRARGPDAGRPRRRHGVHAQRRAPLAALRRLRARRHPPRRHPPRADRRVRRGRRGPRSRVASASPRSPPGPGVTNGVSAITTARG